MTRSTDTLRTAESRSKTWRSSIDALARATRELGPADREALAPLLQSLRDRLQTIENAILQLGQLEEAWSKVGRDTRNSMRELERTYATVVARVLASESSRPAQDYHHLVRSQGNRSTS